MEFVKLICGIYNHEYSLTFMQYKCAEYICNTLDIITCCSDLQLKLPNKRYSTEMIWNVSYSLEYDIFIFISFESIK